MSQPSSVSPIRSGIEMLRGRWDSRSVDWSVVLNRLYADESTWCRWQGVTELRAYEALALHHHLDPDALNLNRLDPKVRARFLEQFGDLGSDGPLATFTVQFVFLADHIRCGRLRCVEIDDRDLVSSVTTVTEFARYVGGSRVQPRPAGQQVGQTSTPSAWPVRHRTSHMQDLVAASALYATVAEGGSYVPGDRTTAPDVAGFLRSTGRMSEKLIAAMVTILWPENLPKGRPPKPRAK
ncbi:hypothetical protein [Piscinibacter terrae]|uniref:hypothetical protein n=1 Tax=Piscinibacter terrae TaxID=2496871 RepID=UPI000F5A90C1|nr:hypothetical protein [Albitalea terrae]